MARRKIRCLALLMQEAREKAEFAGSSPLCALDGDDSRVLLYYPILTTGVIKTGRPVSES